MKTNNPYATPDDRKIARELGISVTRLRQYREEEDKSGLKETSIPEYLSGIEEVKSGPSVTVDRGMNYLTVLINGIPHVRFCVATIIGFQTYFWNSKRGPFARPVSDEPTFSIELYFTDADKITLQYDSRALWEQIIQAINKNL